VQYGSREADILQYDASNFFDEFSFFTGADPTYGFVSYVSEGAAENSNLVGYTNGQVYLGVDSSTYNPAGGRASVRLSSNAAFGNVFLFNPTDNLKLT
jgi:hypothetical protein